MPEMPDNHPHARIKKLSPLLVNQLAAGEVVTRPAAVVKELLENAIDAGATNVEVHITQGGMGMIEVIDNGTGIHPDDMVMAITRHATSKVADVANLQGITTLGFRGEALAATAAVSRLTLTSSHDDSGVGRQLQVAGVLDDTPKLMPVVHQRGTTITVKDLYFNVPARRGNLKSIATEFGHIETIVREVALARADVALTLFHDNKKRLSLSANSNSNEAANRLPLSRLEQATGLPLIDKALPIAIDLTSLIQQPRAYVNNNYDGQASINGWLWPSTNVQDAFPKLFYVNGRLVKEALISNQLRQLAQSAQLTGIGYALYFDLPTEWLNINVHPSKQRIKISPLNNIMAHLSHAIQAKLRKITVNEKSFIKTHSSRNKTAINTLVSNSVWANQPYASTLPPQQNRYANRQVNELKQPYQCSNNIDGPQSLEVANHSKDINQGPAKNAVNASSNVPIQAMPLPYCLDVIALDTIHALDSLVGKSAETENIDDKTLPWLLFYSRSQFLIIGADIWQSQLNFLFESEALRKSALATNANDINQWLTELGAQMSAEDLWAFKSDLEGLLAKHAFKSISNQQLMALMLSSTPN